MTVEEILENEDNRFTVEGYSGIAFYCIGKETKPDEDTEWTGYEVETGNVLMVMVGDDHKFSIDPDDVSPLSPEKFCPECGQIGCRAYG